MTNAAQMKQTVNRSFLRWLACMAVVPLGACMTIGGIEGPIGKNPEVATFVIGVEPKDAWIAIFPGETTQAGMNFSDVSRAVYYGPSKDGYIIGQVESGKPLGIMQVRLVSKPGGFVGTNYEACEQGKTLVFSPVAGSVIYIGHVRYGHGAGVLDVAYTDRFDEAKAVVAARLGPEAVLERSEPRVLSAIDVCRQAAYSFPR